MKNQKKGAGNRLSFCAMSSAALRANLRVNYNCTTEVTVAQATDSRKTEFI